MNHITVTSTLHAAVGLLLLTACSSTSTTGATGGETTGGGMTADEAALACQDDDFVSDHPFNGPGWDADKGVPLGPAQKSYLATTTKLVPRTDAESLALFDKLNGGIVEQLEQHDGLIGYSFANSKKCGYARTLAVWRDEESMMKFVTSGAHLGAMGQVNRVGITGSVTSWDIDASDLPPTWLSAREQVAGKPPVF